MLKLFQNSTNGTFVNGKRILKLQPCLLNDNDEIQLARFDPKKNRTQFDDKCNFKNIIKPISIDTIF